MSRCFLVAKLEAFQIRHFCITITSSLSQTCNSSYVRPLSERYHHSFRCEPDPETSQILSKRAPCPGAHCPSPPKPLYLGSSYSASKLWSKNLCIQQTFPEPAVQTNTHCSVLPWHPGPLPPSYFLLEPDWLSSCLNPPQTP